MGGDIKPTVHNGNEFFGGLPQAVCCCRKTTLLPIMLTILCFFVFPMSSLSEMGC